MSRTVLVIEDDPRCIHLVMLILNSQGYGTVVTESGLEGLEKARASLPDLILLDLLLPDVSGFEVLREIRSDSLIADVPVVITSSKSQSSDKEMADELGTNAYLTKPFRKADLVTAIETLMGESNDE